ncbi:hypothetical protein Plhal703r1_c17g0078771 [Plasmopara halstedii]
MTHQRIQMHQLIRLPLISNDHSAVRTPQITLGSQIENLTIKLKLFPCYSVNVLRYFPDLGICTIVVNKNIKTATRQLFRP